MTNSTNNNNNILAAAHTLAAAIAKGADLHFYAKFQGVRCTNQTTGAVEALNNEVHTTQYPDYYTMVSATPEVVYADIESVDEEFNTLAREVQEGSSDELEALKENWVIWPVFFESFKAALDTPTQKPNMFGKTKEEYCVAPSELTIDRVKLARLIEWDLVKEETPMPADYSRPVVRSTEKVGGTFADLF